MQAAPVIAVVAPQAAVDTSARPAGSDGNKTQFTEFLQRSLSQALTPPLSGGETESAGRVVEEEVPREEMAEDGPGEEIAAETLGAVMLSGITQAGGLAAVEAAVPDGAAEESAAAVEGPAGDAWAPPQVPEDSAGGAAARVHVDMVREKIAGIMEADKAALDEPEAAEPSPEAAADVSGAEEAEIAPEVEIAEESGERSALAESPERGPKETARADEAHRARGLAGAAAAAHAAPAARGAPRAETQIRLEAAERALMRFSQDLLELRTGVSEIRLTLEPESLGELTISVMKTEKGVSARISSPDRAVCSAVADKLPVLVQTIEQSGLTVQDLEVIHAPASFAGNAAQPGQSGRQGSRRGAFFRIAAASPGDDESAFWSGFHQSVRADDATVVYRV